MPRGACVFHPFKKKKNTIVPSIIASAAESKRYIADWLARACIGENHHRLPTAELQ